MAKAKLLEPLDESFRRHAAVRSAFKKRGDLTEVPAVAPVVFEGKAAVVPWSEVRRAIEPEEQPALPVSVSEAVRLEVGSMTELEHEVPVAELQDETARADAPRLEVAMFADETAVMELEAMRRAMEFRAGV